MLNQMPQKIFERLAMLVIAIIFLLIMSIAGELDYQDAIEFEKQYMEDVCNKVYPNYKKWDIDCSKGELK